MDYDLYHDESKEDGYWHGMLFVPRSTRKLFLNHIGVIRERHHYRDVLTLKGLNRTSGPKYSSIRDGIQLAVGALIQDHKGKPYQVYAGRTGRNVKYAILKETIGARFALFRVPSGSTERTSYRDYGSWVETTFRMGLKGALNLFADEGRPITVRSFHFDGHEHYGRKIDRNRIIDRLRGLRDPVAVASDAEIYDRPGDHRESTSQGYDDCQCLQMADLLVGGFRTILGPERNPVQRQVAYPLEVLAKSWHEGPARMRNSRWHKGFCISEGYLKNDEWRFSDLRREIPSNQAMLPGLG